MLGNRRGFAQLVGALENELSDFRAEIIAAANSRHFPANRKIICQHEPATEVFLVLEGKAKALLYSEQGSEVWFNDFHCGEFFGELAALGDQTRSADIFATTDLTAAVFPAEKFIRLMKSDGAFALIVTRQIVRRFKRTSDRMFEMSALSAPGRIYAELLRMAEPQSEISDEGVLTIPMMPPMTELARRVNSTRETVSRTIKALEEKGLLTRTSERMARLIPKIDTLNAL